MLCEIKKHQIKELFFSGKTVTEISNDLKIDRWRIYSYFKKNNIKYDIKSRFPLGLLKQELLKGSSIKAFCKKYKTSRKQFFKLCKEYNYDY